MPPPYAAPGASLTPPLTPSLGQPLDEPPGESPGGSLADSPNPAFAPAPSAMAAMPAALPAQVQRNARNDWLQALRALAALAVLCFHMQPHWATSPQLGPLLQWARQGFAGVDVFFVLSGFVVYLSAARGLADGSGMGWFLRRRALRVYLGYWPVFLLSVLVLALNAGAWPALDAKLLRSALLLQPDTWRNTVPTAWSLSFELWFYLWLGLIVFRGGRYTLAILCAVALWMVVWNGGWLWIDRHAVYYGYEPLRYLFTGLMPEFLAGALVAHASLRWPNLFARWLPWTVLAVLLMLLGWRLGASSIWFNRVEVMRAASYGTAGLGALLLALVLSRSGWNAPALLVGIGDASYSLYLLHPLLLDESGALRFRYLEAFPMGKNLFLLALPIVIVGLSLLWFRWIEKPTIAWTARSRPRAAAVGAAQSAGAPGAAPW